MAEQALRRRHPSGPDELVQHRRGDPQVGPQVHRIQGPDPDLQPIQISQDPSRISDADCERHPHGKEC